jgi:hypothetical protein
MDKIVQQSRYQHALNWALGSQLTPTVSISPDSAGAKDYHLTPFCYLLGSDLNSSHCASSTTCMNLIRASACLGNDKVMGRQAVRQINISLILFQPSCKKYYKESLSWHGMLLAW